MLVFESGSSAGAIWQPSWQVFLCVGQQPRWCWSSWSARLMTEKVGRSSLHRLVAETLAGM